MKYIHSFLVLVSFLLLSLSAYCQVDRGGVPRSFRSSLTLKSQSSETDFSPPDLVAIQQEDFEDARLEKSYRVGIEVPVTISTSNAGQWDYIPGSGRLWRHTIRCKGAKGIGLNYRVLHLPPGADIFVYTSDHKYVIGAITSTEIPANKIFTTRPLPGDELTIEYFEPFIANEPAEIEISGIAFLYRGFESPEAWQNKSALSGDCEVNINCEEGQNWQNQKSGVVKILTKVGSRYFYCTGSVMNNTSQDFSGLMLTASHCSKDFAGGIASDEDYSKWVFYFNYETPGCSESGPVEFTLVGAEKLATSDTPSEIGSDFLLLNFLTPIPPKYNPYYCGWDMGNGNSSSGVSIHHPDGDVKKISTYNSLLGSGTWGAIPNTHWTVHWAATANGHGVTEGGSSGAPLFDYEGLLIGTLTGGLSNCSNTGGEDMYGKISYSWESNGPSANQQLKPWLDPQNTGIIKMPGSFNEKLAVADFSANSKITPVGGTIDFQDLSSGKPDNWHWYFQGAKPSESNEQNPTGIRFERFGEMNVKLVVSNEYNSDSIVKEGYIDVRAVVSPNPTTGVVTILTDINNTNDIIIEVYDVLGKMVQQFEYAGSASASCSINLPEYGTIFLIRVIHGDQVQTHRIIVYK